jgi:hypothetical protein
MHFCNFSATLPLSKISTTLLSEVIDFSINGDLLQILGNADSGQVEVFSSKQNTSCDVIFSPLVADLVDILFESPAEVSKV